MPDFRAVSSTAQHLSMLLPRIKPPSWQPISLLARGPLAWPTTSPLPRPFPVSVRVFPLEGIGKRDTTQAVSDLALVEALKERHIALRVSRSPLQCILANGKTPSVLPTSENPLPNVEALNNARTLLAGFFSSLLARIVHDGLSRNHMEARR